mgnify:CR=1 FL=1
MFFNIKQHNYQYLQILDTKSFNCGYCGDKVSSNKGYKIGQHNDGSGRQVGGVYICPSCQGPTFFTLNNLQIPGGKVGSKVKYLPDNLSQLYEEARNCVVNDCNTAAVLLSRKMLMHIAVEVGAEEGLKFIEYVNYLSEKGYIPPNGRHWIDHIRKKGNEANHEIVLMSQQHASELLFFIEMLLRFIYEFPNAIQEDPVEV